VISVRELDGPSVVWAGRENGPALVVIDPLGRGLPPTWNQLAEHFQIAWCRPPASERSLEDIEDVLESLTERQAPVNIVASGEACPAAIAIARQFADVVAAVLLVDPVGDDPSPLAGTDVELMVVATGAMPLEDAAVVESVVSALASLE
jgi:pimeloyl-ACP methyl ester carboxylesterase